MARKKLDEKTRGKAIAEFKKLIEKYGVSVHTIDSWIRDDRKKNHL